MMPSCFHISSTCFIASSIFHISLNLSHTFAHGFLIFQAYSTGSHWLLLSTPLKNMKVTWDDEKPNIWKTRIDVPNQPTVVYNGKEHHENG